jgi:hypothetical protein
VSNAKNVDQTPVFKFAAYKSAEAYSAYRAIYNQSSDIIKTYITQGDLDKVGLKEYCTFSYISYFNDVKDNIKSAVTNFYNNGKGYTLVRQRLVEFSNPQLIKEIRTILKYYYSIVIRKQNADQVEVIDEQKTQALESTVVDQMKVLLTLETASANLRQVYTDTQSDVARTLNENHSQIITRNEADPNFASYYDRLKKVYAYTIIYCSPAWVRTLPDDNFKASFSDAYDKMPHLLNVKSFPSNEQTFIQEIKDAFSEHYTKHMKSYLEDISSATPPHTAITSGVDASTLVVPTTASDSVFAGVCTKVLNDMRDIFDKYYTMSILQCAKDTKYWFPYDTTYLVRNLSSFQRSAFNSTTAIVSSDGLLQDFMYSVKQTIASQSAINALKQSINYKDQQAAIVQRLTPIVEKMNIKLADYSTFITGKVTEGSAGPSGELASILKQTILMIDMNVAQKANMNTKTIGQKSTEMRFLDADQFVTKIDALTFNDFKTGLNIEWFKDVTSIFYTSISNATNSESRTTKDIYVHEKKRQRISFATFITLTITFIFVLIYHLMNVYKEYTSMGAIANANTADKKWAIVDSKVNIIFKGIIPIAALVFFICLFWSIIKKSEAKFNFNRETIDSNTSKFKKSVFELNGLIEDITKKIRPAETTKIIKDLKQITFDDKVMIHEYMKTIIDKSEKCNYILAVQSGDIPFPYSEIVIDAFMALVCILCILFIISKINPIEKMRNIKTLYTLKERGMYLDGDPSFKSEITTKAKCHDTDIESIIFTVKILFFLFIVAFLIFYAGKVVESTSEYQGGLYNSYYYDESICVA